MSNTSTIEWRWQWFISDWIFSTNLVLRIVGNFRLQYHRITKLTVNTIFVLIIIDLIGKITFVGHCSNDFLGALIYNEGLRQYPNGSSRIVEFTLPYFILSQKYFTAVAKTCKRLTYDRRLLECFVIWILSGKGFRCPLRLYEQLCEHEKFAAMIWTLFVFIYNFQGALELSKLQKCHGDCICILW